MSSYNDKTYIVFLDLPKNIQEKIDLVRSKYNDSGHKKWHSHVTFKQDEDFLLTEDKAIKLIKDFFNDVAPIKIGLDGLKIKYFNNEGWNIFIAISDNIYFRKKVKQLSLIMEQCVDLSSKNALESTKWEQGDNFYPHVSLRGGLIKAEGKRIFEQIALENFDMMFPIKVICRSVTLARWNIDHWQEIVRIELNKCNS